MLLSVFSCNSWSMYSIHQYLTSCLLTISGRIMCRNDAKHLTLRNDKMRNDIGDDRTGDCAHHAGSRMRHDLFVTSQRC